MPIRSHLLVEDVMSRWPATIRVFLDFRMGCVGCPIAASTMSTTPAASMASTQTGSWRL